jgi:hypothetical protein
LSKDKWKGLRPVQTDKDFFQFVDMPHGYRAMLITLQNYRRKHGCRTIAAMIKRYAPATENNTSGYLSRVCNDLQVPTTYEPDVSDKQVMCALAAAMSRVENGVPAVMRDIEAGWDLI